MKSTGFGYPGGPDRAANLELPVTSYSGGWKMKVQLCAAQLMNCDVFMLDEPTGHLDVDNINWLEDRKLKTFKGVKGNTLTMFVEKYPEKKAYFELSNETMEFAFPEPGPFEGVKSRGKVVLRMMSVDSQTVSEVSRVAVIGASGEGKSTAIRVLVGEPLPTSGSIWKAAGLRLAYVAHHAFHHLEKHMQETPTQYIMWRFAGNDGKESLEFKSDELSVDEESARSVKWCIDGVTGSVRPCTDPKSDAKKAKADVAGAVVPEATVSRRQKKKEKTYEYEVKWQFKPIETNVWVEKDILFKWATRSWSSARMSVRRRWLATRPSCSRGRVLRSFLVTSVNGEAHVLEDRETAGLFLRDQGTDRSRGCRENDTAAVIGLRRAGRQVRRGGGCAFAVGWHLARGAQEARAKSDVGWSPEDGTLCRRASGGEAQEEEEHELQEQASSSEASGSSSSGSSTSGSSSTVPSEEFNADVEALVALEEITPKMANVKVPQGFDVMHNKGGAGSPAAPQGLCVGGESAGAWPCTVLCPRRVLGEAHRSAASVCRRRVRLASDFVFVKCTLSLGSPSFRVAGCRRGVRLMPGLFCMLRGLTHFL